MSVDRRQFLAGCTGAGLLAGTPALAVTQRLGLLGPALAPAADGLAAGVLLLRAPGDTAFEAGVRRVLRHSAVPHIDTLELDPALARTPGALRAVLAARRGTALLGLMDDCTHTLLEECLRDLGGSLLCRGQHFGSANQRADSRHLFTTTATTRGVGQALAAALATGTDAYLVREQALADATGAASGLRARLDPHWPAALGIAYGRMAAGRWAPAPLNAHAQRGIVTTAPDARSLVSLFARI